VKDFINLFNGAYADITTKVDNFYFSNLYDHYDEMVVTAANYQDCIDLYIIMETFQQKVYSTNGNVDEGELADLTTQFTSHIHKMETDFQVVVDNGPDTNPYEGNGPAFGYPDIPFN